RQQRGFESLRRISETTKNLPPLILLLIVIIQILHHDFLSELKTLEKTVDVAERNAARFGLSAEEVQERRAFVSSQRAILDTIRSQLQKAIERENKEKRKAAENGGAGGEERMLFTSSSHLVREETTAAIFHNQQKQHQTLLLQQQDSQLEEISQSASKLHETALMINQELQDQHRMLDELDEDIDQQAAQMNFLMRRMAKILKTSSVRQLCLILWLTCIALLLFLLLIIT
ncbi:syntaxin n-terminal protein, partial [Cystoisospora suis]